MPSPNRQHFWLLNLGSCLMGLAGVLQLLINDWRLGLLLIGFALLLRSYVNLHAKGQPAANAEAGQQKASGQGLSR